MNSNRQTSNIMLQVALIAVLLVMQSGFSAEAQRRGGGGGGRAAAATHGGGGAARASAHPSVNRPAHQAQVGNRSGNYSGNHSGNANRNINHNENINRNTNINRDTNINRNTNVNVDVNNDYHGNHWNDWDDHPFATAAAVTAGVAITSAVIGSIVYSVPPSCVTTVVNGIAYQQCGSTWYEPRYSGTNVQYVVINAP